MKRILSSAGLSLLLLFLLLYPREALSASREGMKLWLNTLLPTLLPFLILTGHLLHTDGIERTLRPVTPLFQKLFGLSGCGACALLLGLLCGYPMGARLASQMYRSGKICRREAEYLLTFSNNPSPAFLLTYLGQVCLKGAVSPLRIIGLLLAADLLCMLFFRFLIYRNRTATEEAFLTMSKKASSVSSPGASLDASIMDGFETIAKLGGYILLFSILSAAVCHFWRTPSMARYAVLGTLELTTGLCRLSDAPLSLSVKYPFAMLLTAFGGLCIMAQTKSVLDKDISFVPYASAKCLNAICTAILLYYLL